MQQTQGQLFAQAKATNEIAHEFLKLWAQTIKKNHFKKQGIKRKKWRIILNRQKVGTFLRLNKFLALSDIKMISFKDFENKTL